jgi:hypothetical protein
MRHLHALIVATGLCVPSLALAAAPVEHGQTATASHAALQAVPAEQAAQQQAKPQTSARSDAADRARYAEKDAKSGETKDYRGGDTVVIGASAATAILAVILLIVLI